jgi:quinone-modifying oxidoreductase subunit QmoC
MTGVTSHGRPPSFIDEVIAATPSEARLRICIQCGTCGGSCPSGADMDHTPRQIFAMMRADMRREVLSSNTPWYCVSCYYCTVRCPQEIHITDIMYTLKRMSLEEGYKEQAKASDFSKTFINWVENYGRAFELGLMSVHMLKHNLLGPFKLADMGLGLVTKGRMDFAPKRIKDIDGLKRILAKAKELAGPVGLEPKGGAA